MVERLLRCTLLVVAVGVAALAGVMANDDVDKLTANLQQSMQQLAAEQTQLQAQRDDAERRLTDNREQLAAQAGALAALRQVQTVLAMTPTVGKPTAPPLPTDRPTP